MTQPNDLPPLPEPPRADGEYSEDNGALSATYTQAKMQAYATAYGLQCAEAAIMEERRRAGQHASAVIRAAEDAMQKIDAGEDA